MKKLLRGCLAAALFLLAQTSVKAQDDPRPFHPVADSVGSALKEQFPQWKRESIPPVNFEGTNTFPYDVIIDQWSSDEASVRVAILINASMEEAKEKLKKFAADVRADGYLPDVGNEAYVWGLDKSVAFRKGIYTVYVSGIRHELSEDGEPMDTTASPKDTKYVKTFAQIVARTLKDFD